MVGFFWNIRGLNKSNKQTVIREWVQMNSFQFGCFIETKVKERKVAKVMNKYFGDWNMVSNYEFSRLGRIWVTWNKQTKVQVVFKSGQLITCSVLLHGATEEFWCSFIYALNTAEERRVLWRDLQQQHDLVSFKGKPWILLGDFNVTLDLEEHSHHVVSPMVTSGMREFQDIVRYCSLDDMRAHGPLFTWCNKREDDLLCKKLVVICIR